MTVSISGLQAIASLASEGSMTAAARALGYTPSAVSQQISKLERDVRQVLVEQNGRVATLSPAGRAVAEAARRILNEIEQMQLQLENERKTVAGTLFGHGVAEYASQIAMVGAGLGVALVPQMGRGSVPDTVRVLPVVPAPTRQVYAVWRSLTGRRPALQAAVLALEESFSEGLDPGEAGSRTAAGVAELPSGRPLPVSSLVPGRTGLSAVG